MTDDIPALTAALAADPSSLGFLELAEELRRRRQLDAAAKVARAGLARYPDLASAHDLVARIAADRGEAAAAAESWRAALAIDPGHVGAHKGMAFLLFHIGDATGALRHLDAAADADPDDIGVELAMARVRAAMVEAAAAAEDAEDAADPDDAPHGSERATTALADVDEIADERAVFAGLEGASDGLLLIDRNGLRLGGGLRSPDGEDVGDTVAAHLAGVTREAARAARLLDLGALDSVAAESPDGNLYLLAPTPDTALLTVRDRSVPVGRLSLMAERAARSARTWLERLA
jgi:predicted regulator of Ras-like GTPase activity (Roadblock/LC7/MglB family)